MLETDGNHTSRVYPYVSESPDGEICVHYRKNTALVIESKIHNTGQKVTSLESKCEDITKEYLSNVWGSVRSPEHYDFIVSLLKHTGLRIWPQNPSLEHKKSSLVFMIYGEKP